MKSVLVFDCQMTNDDRRKEIKYKTKNVTDYFDFEYKRSDLLVYRSWNVSSSLLVPWPQLDHRRTIPSLTSKTIEGSFL